MLRSRYTIQGAAWQSDPYVWQVKKLKLLCKKIVLPQAAACEYAMVPLP